MEEKKYRITYSVSQHNSQPTTETSVIKSFRKPQIGEGFTLTVYPPLTKTIIKVEETVYPPITKTIIKVEELDDNDISIEQNESPPFIEKTNEINEFFNEENLIKYIDKTYNIYSGFYDVIGKTIDYPPDKLDCIIRKENYKYKIVDDEIIMYDGDGEQYIYTISSEGMKGEKLYMGSIGKYEIVMCYYDNWDNAEIFILDRKNSLDDVKSKDDFKTRTEVLNKPIIYSLSEIFKQLKFGRTAKDQKFLDKCLKKLNNE